MLAFLRANPVVAGIGAGCAILLIVSITLAVLMLRAGVSLRPLVFFLGAVALVAGPQVAYHLGRATGAIPPHPTGLVWTARGESGTSSRQEGVLRENERALAARDGRFDDHAAVFGPDHDPDLVITMRTGTLPIPIATRKLPRWRPIREAGACR